MSKLLQEQIERRESAIKTYDSLITYWSKPYRIVAESSRMNQTREFIAEQLIHCKEMLQHHQQILSELIAVK
jgi:hypothetical protein